MYLSAWGEPSQDEGGSPFYAASRIILIINPVNIMDGVIQFVTDTIFLLATNIKTKYNC